jgi:two-component system heavy metal sensor histidine kinase CusS
MSSKPGADDAGVAGAESAMPRGLQPEALAKGAAPPPLAPRAAIHHPGRRPWSLAGRLTAWYAGSAFALVLAATGFLYWALAAHLDRQDDQFLVEKVHSLEAILRDRPRDTATLRREAQEDRISARILDARAAVIVETFGMAESLPHDAFPGPAPGGEYAAADVLGREGRSFRTLTARDQAGRVIQVALDRSWDDELLAGYRRSLWLVLVVALVACALGGYRIAHRGIRPVREIAETARRIRATTLGERIAAAGLPAELAALADTFNAMLDRLEESFARLGRFDADIAHELRTPVHALRGEVEVALGRARSPEEYREILGSCLEECVRLSGLIERLLFLARAEDPKTQIQRERVDVGRELAAVQEFYEPAAAEAGVRLSLDVPQPLAADLDRPLWQRAVSNLVENALAFTPSGGSVTLSATPEGGGVRVTVADTGCGIPAADLPRLFDRFYHVDPARSSRGLGLGLSIVQTVAGLHGGTVEIASAVGQGTRVTLHFPALNGS